MILTPDDLLASSFRDPFRTMLNWEADHVWLAGGRGSAKSTAAAFRVLFGLELDREANAVVYRKHQNGLRDSVYAQILWCLNKLGWMGEYDAQLQPMQIVRRGTGQKILFRGLDDPLKTRSIKCERGYIQLAWFEELAEYEGLAEIEDVERSVGRGGPHFQMIGTYNPPETKAAWVNMEAGKFVPNRKVFTSDYRIIAETHPDWLGPVFIRDAELMRESNPMRYRHVYLGEATGTGGEVFRNVEARAISDDEINSFRRKRWGMDFGQADPTVLIGTAWDRDADTVYLFDEWYKRDAFNDDVFGAIKNRGLLAEPIIGDEGGGGKGVIKELRRMGARRIQEAYKPAGSVDKGVRWIRERAHVVIDSTRCPNAWHEFSQYEYARLRDGTYRNEYPDLDNHTIDAVRYAHEDAILGAGRSTILF